MLETYAAYSTVACAIFLCATSHPSLFDEERNIISGERDWKCNFVSVPSKMATPKNMVLINRLSAQTWLAEWQGRLRYASHRWHSAARNLSVGRRRRIGGVTSASQRDARWPFLLVTFLDSFSSVCAWT